MTQGSQHSPLHAAHDAAGGRFVTFAGWRLPVHYGSILDEGRAVRGDAGMFDVSHMGRTRMTGPEALDVLQSLGTNDLTRVAPGKAQYTLWCTPDGGAIDDLIGFWMAPDEFLIVMNASRRADDLDHLREHAKGRSVTIDDETEGTAMIAVQGPKAREKVARLGADVVASMPRFGVTTTTVAGVPATIARTGYTGEDGVEIICTAASGGAVFNALREAGVVPCGLGARDALRMEMGYPLYGHELGLDISPLEAGVSFAVSFTDREFIGRDALAKQAEAGPQRRLAGFVCDQRAVPQQGDEIGPGTVTSGGTSVVLDKPIGLAFVPTNAGLGRATLHTRNKEIPSELRELPLIPRVTRTKKEDVMSDAGDFVPHTAADIEEMLAVIGRPSVDDLFDVVPAGLRDPTIDLMPALSEPDLVRHVSELASRNAPAGAGLNFLGGGIYDHYVPAAVRALVSRGEFATAYTPYQAEASQGTLQALFEFQTMIAELFGLQVSNASLYDGGTSLVEAVNVAAMRRPGRRVLIAGGVNVRYRRVLETYADGLGIRIEVLPSTDLGTDPQAVADAVSDDPILAVVVQQPNAYGFLEEAAEIAAAARDAEAVVIGVADPMTLGILAPPGEWGAHIALAEGQALGNPMSMAGQCVGLFACDETFARHIPGRLVGETVDAEGRRGYVLTLQAREQHIKREKAGSNICTNQTLFALAVAVHLAWLGPEGLRRVGEQATTVAHAAAGWIDRDTSFRIASSRSFTREFAVRSSKPASDVVRELRDRGIYVGPASSDHVDVFNIAFTEKRTMADVDVLVDALKEIGKS